MNTQSRSEGIGDTLTQITFLGFNQDATCLAVGTVRGFIIYKANPFQRLYKEECGSVSIVEMLFSTSLLAVVGSGNDLSSSSRILTLYNSKERRQLASLAFVEAINSCKMNPLRLVVFLSSEIRIYDLKTLKFLHRILRDSASLLAGAEVSALSGHFPKGYLATPGGKEKGVVTIIDTYTMKGMGSVSAHRSPIRVLAFNAAASLLATASFKGTILRVWSVPDFERLYCFRRGSMESIIHSLSFSLGSDFLASTGASSTIHVFKLEIPPSERAKHQAPSQSQINSALASYIWGASEHERKQVKIDQESSTSLELPFTIRGVSTPSSSTLLELSGMAVSALSSLANYLPESYRDVIEASRCFAFVNLRNFGNNLRSVSHVTWNNKKNKCEVLVACQSGCAYCYDCEVTGGECRLRDEYLLQNTMDDV